MRHQVEKRKLGRTSAHRDAMLRNMVTSLLEYERIETTLQKAKEVRRVAERMITLAKKGDLHSLRQALRVIRKKTVAKKLFDEMAIRFNDRNGGYTRILKVGQRAGDNASMAIIELVAKTPVKKPKKSQKTEKKSPIQAAREAAKKPKTKAAAKPKAKKEAPKKAAPAKGTKKKAAGETKMSAPGSGSAKGGARKKTGKKEA